MNLIDYQWRDGEELTLKLLAGKYVKPVIIKKEGRRFWLNFKYNEKLLDEVKNMEGAKWHGYDENNPRKAWSITDSGRNRFQLQYLCHYLLSDELNPYNQYTRPLIEFNDPNRPLYDHQLEGVKFSLTKKQCALIFEMALGKTLTAIEVMEHLRLSNIISGTIFWIGPQGALYSVEREFVKWNAKVRPDLILTYDRLKKVVEQWVGNKVPPQVLICDEAQKIKNPTSQRSQAVKFISEEMRKYWGSNCYIILLSGNPAPKDPADFWNLCETIAPGFLKEGNVQKFKNRLALIEQRESMAGGKYPQLVTWWDDPNKCAKCGQLPEHPAHDPIYIESYHKHIPSKNEVEYLYKRMAPITIVKTKKECLNLPDKIFRIIELRPSQNVLNAAKAIQAKCSTTIQALTLLRELSDGFQYQEYETENTKECPRCLGSTLMEEYFDQDNPDEMIYPEEFEKGQRYNTETNDFSGPKINIGKRFIPCSNCDASGRINTFRRGANQVQTPKDDATRDILDEHEDIGRIVIYGGFQGTIDRIDKLCKEIEWDTIRVDGRGWHSTLREKHGFKRPNQLLDAFDDRKNYDKIAFIAQSSSGGIGLNLQASPTILFYSNSFDGDGRSQAIERTHRPGMDLNLGCTIIDLIHLPSDKLVLDNLNQKKKLQSMSLGLFMNSLKEYEQVVT